MTTDPVVWVSFQIVRPGVAQVANLEHTVPADLSGFGLVEALRDEVKRVTGCETMVLRSWQPLRRTTAGRRITTTYLVSYQDESRVIAGVGEADLVAPHPPKEIADIRNLEAAIRDDRGTAVIVSFRLVTRPRGSPSAAC